MKSQWFGTAAALLLAACAGPPPLQPRILESPEQVAARARHFWPVFTIETSGHRYFVAVSSDVMNDVIYDYSRLIFVDDRYACREDFRLKHHRYFSGDTTPWEWVSQPGGLDYIADRLLQTCGRADEKPLRPWPTGDVPPGVAAKPPCCRGTEPPFTPGPGALVIPSMAALVMPPFGILAASGIDAGSHLHARGFDERLAEIQVGMPVADLERILGTPSGSFELPDAGATVRAYEGLSWRWYFGVQNDRVIWIHRPYPWLHELTKAAADKTK